LPWNSRSAESLINAIAYYAGMVFRASFWGISCDFTGHKFAFNMTILTGAVFALAVAGFDNFGSFCFMWTIVGKSLDLQ
jgi:hypothetical protein